MSVDHERLKRAATEVLLAIGEDPARAGLVDTPRRFADAWTEFIDYNPGRMETHFATVESNQMVVVSGMETWSLCEHHLLPFRVRIAIGYIPETKLLGLSKFGRIVEQAAHRLQLQERLTRNIADRVKEYSGAASVGVLAEGEHLCMVMRGVKMPATMRTSVLEGLFRDAHQARAEFLTLAKA